MFHTLHSQKITQKENNSPSKMEQGMDWEILKLWQKELNHWKNSHKLFSRQHPAWRMLQALYQDFWENNSQKEQGMELLAMHYFYTTYQRIKSNEVKSSQKMPLIAYKFDTVLKSLQKTHPLDFSISFQNWLEEFLSKHQNISSNTLIQSKLESSQYKPQVRETIQEYLPFVLAGADFYAQKYFSYSLKDKEKKVLLQGSMGEGLLHHCMDFLPKKGLKNRLSEDFFWHNENLLQYYDCFQHEELSEKIPNLTWGKLTQLRQSSWESLQPTLFSPVSEEQKVLQKLQKSSFSFIFLLEFSDITQNAEMLADSGLFAGLVDDKQVNHLTDWQIHFSNIHTWKFPQSEYSLVFAIKKIATQNQVFTPKYHQIPKLQFPLSWKALQDIFADSDSQVLEEAPSAYLPKSRPNTKNKTKEFYPLLAQDTAIGEINEGIFSTYFTGLSLSKNSELWDDSEAKLQEKVVKYLSDTAPRDSKVLQKLHTTALFSSPQLSFDTQKTIKLAIHPFQETKVYFDSKLWNEGGQFVKIFKANHAQIFVHLHISAKQQSTWASTLPVARNFMGKTFSLSQYRYDAQGKPQENIRSKALQKFKEYYETQWQEQAESLRLSLQNLLNMSHLEDCQVEPELAVELRPLVQLSENVAFAKQLFKNIYQPNEATQVNFKSLKEIFLRMKKAFEQMGKRYSRGKESYDTLHRYFVEGEESLQLLDEYMEEAARREIDLEREIKHSDIFEYVYAVLQVTSFEASHTLEELQIPLLNDFWAWVEWGRTLLDLHLREEESYARPLKITERYLRKRVKTFKAKFLSQESSILLQDQHSEWLIQQLPSEIFEHQLGKQLTLEWLLQALAEKYHNPEAEESFLENQKEEIKETLQKHIRIISETVKIQKTLQRVREEG